MLVLPWRFVAASRTPDFHAWHPPHAQCAWIAQCTCTTASHPDWNLSGVALRCPAFAGLAPHCVSLLVTPVSGMRMRHETQDKEVATLPASNCSARKLQISARCTCLPCCHDPQMTLQPLRHVGVMVMRMGLCRGPSVDLFGTLQNAHPLIGF